MIEVKHLTKRYGSHTAVSDLSFTVEKGQIYGFLGPNGAGKSTTMNIMTGCLAATSGEVVIGGYDIFQDAAQAKRLIGYLPEQPPLYLDRTPKEYLRFVARAKGIAEKNISAELDRVMTVTGTLDVADRLMKNLSKGYRQRVGIAQAVLGDPEVIILDEPTVGLDPRQITEIRELIRQLGKERTEHIGAVLPQCNCNFFNAVVQLLDIIIGRLGFCKQVGQVADEGIGGIIVDDLVGLLDDLLVIFGGHIALFFPYITGRSAAFQKSGKKQAVDG